MLKRLAVFVLLPVLAGCLTASQPETVCWPVEFVMPDGARAADEPVAGVARVSQVIVRAPYGEKEMAVLRADGSLAFDGYNEYAANPAILLKGVVFDALEASGLCRTVVGSASSAVTPTSVEVTFTRLCLDCRNEGSRLATAAVSVRVLGKDESVRTEKGAGSADAADGNYGKAFSGAVSEALTEALKKFRR